MNEIDEHLVDTLHDIFEEYKQCDVGEEIAKALKLAGYTISQPQEPQKKSEKQKVADLLGVPVSEVHTLDIQEGKLIEIIDEPPESLASTEMLLDSDKRCDIQDEFFKRYNKLPSPEIQSDITNLIFLVAEQQLTQCQSIIAKKYESEINKLRAQITELTK